MSDDNLGFRLKTAGQVFTPGSPVNERDLFAGRIEQLDKVEEAISQTGYHAVIYGERGVGKTSLANVLRRIYQINDIDVPEYFSVAKVTCDAGDNFYSLWRKAAGEILVPVESPGLGFGAVDTMTLKHLADWLPESPSPHDIRRLLDQLTRERPALVIFDEFDRLSDDSARDLMADTIKALSDNGSSVTIVIVGVAISIEQLIRSHASVERALVQIPMPRMSKSEIKEIIDKGLARLKMSIEKKALAQLVSLSQGLPYIAHLLALNVTRAALLANRIVLQSADVESGISKSLEQWQQSIKTSYYDATRNPQPGNIFKEVLLACALAETDDLGYFTAPAVRTQVRQITGRNYDIPNFARHLKLFSEDSRGGMLERMGETRRLRYRFVGPLLRPFIIMKGVEQGLITKDAIAA
ncbi:AAA family ATPase [Glacieibacterium frigidum]|uniref:AAA family ATPase n=1 Tax=Glacieibacterium frigidum TaxID=2593303 RepID=A0A552UHB0_9SPHN|nr:AAA family ATPase [Glacieibacterium frigidum]TRW17614.1 AAA family ATPase [Glacieibacterium frigidum]